MKILFFSFFLTTSMAIGMAPSHQDALKSLKSFHEIDENLLEALKGFDALEGAKAPYEMTINGKKFEILGSVEKENNETFEHSSFQNGESGKIVSQTISKMVIYLVRGQDGPPENFFLCFKFVYTVNGQDKTVYLKTTNYGIEEGEHYLVLQELSSSSPGKIRWFYKEIKNPVKETKKWFEECLRTVQEGQKGPKVIFSKDGISLMHVENKESQTVPKALQAPDPMVLQKKIAVEALVKNSDLLNEIKGKSLEAARENIQAKWDKSAGELVGFFPTTLQESKKDLFTFIVFHQGKLTVILVLETEPGNFFFYSFDPQGELLALEHEEEAMKALVGQEFIVKDEDKEVKISFAEKGNNPTLEKVLGQQDVCEYSVQFVEGKGFVMPMKQNDDPNKVDEKKYYEQLDTLHDKGLTTVKIKDILPQQQAIEVLLKDPQILEGLKVAIEDIQKINEEAGNLKAAGLLKGFNQEANQLEGRRQATLAKMMELLKSKWDKSAQSELVSFSPAILEDSQKLLLTFAMFHEEKLTIVLALENGIGNFFFYSFDPQGNLLAFDLDHEEEALKALEAQKFKIWDEADQEVSVSFSKKDNNPTLGKILNQPDVSEFSVQESDQGLVMPTKTNERNKAATKIQSHFRGHLDRVKAKKMKEKAQEEADSKPADPQGQAAVLPSQPTFENKSLGAHWGEKLDLDPLKSLALQVMAAVFGNEAQKGDAGKNVKGRLETVKEFLQDQKILNDQGAFLANEKIRLAGFVRGVFDHPDALFFTFLFEREGQLTPILVAQDKKDSSKRWTFSFTPEGALIPIDSQSKEKCPYMETLTFPKKENLGQKNLASWLLKHTTEGGESIDDWLNQSGASEKKLKFVEGKGFE